eukprot:m.8415 g.8415  ORF g.8415 m.8415 type:complete len:694 (+) comp3886_c0_seq1:214-2295(+)
MSRLDSKLSERASDITYEALPDDDEGAYANFAQIMAEPEPTPAAAPEPKLEREPSKRGSADIPGLKDEDVVSKDGNLVTMLDRKPSMSEKARLAQEAMKQLNLRPGSRVSMIETSTDPSIKVQTAKRPQGLRGSLKDSMKSTASAPAELPGVQIPARADMPKANPDFVDEEYGESSFDFYISYCRGVDDDPAFKLQEMLESNVSTSDGNGVNSFFDRKSIRSMYLDARGEWRKRAPENRVHGLAKSNCFLVLLSPEALAKLRNAHKEENFQLLEIEYAMNTTKPVIPVYIPSSSGRMPSKPAAPSYSDSMPYHPWAKATVQSTMDSFLKRESVLLCGKRLESSTESLVECLSVVANGDTMPAQKSPASFDPKPWEPSVDNIKKKQEEKKAALESQVARVQEEENVETMDWGHWQLERDTVEIQNKLGSGEFGDVCKGILHGTGEHKGMQAWVAIKTLKKGSRTEFLLEAKTMVHLKHKNLVNIYGVCTTEEPVLIVAELCEYGSLKDFLPRRKAATLTLENLLDMIKEVAAGMQHVEAVGFVHRDLAARNVLVEDHPQGYRCKVADFGLAVELDEGKEIFQGDVNQPVPIRWTAPEAIRKGKFSHKSDVWSFGITCYEIITFGNDPYEGANNQEVVTMVCEQGVRLPCPKEPRARRGCPKILHDIMLMCWEHYPTDRPSFDDLVETHLPTVTL